MPTPPTLNRQSDTMLARVKSGGVAAPLCGCGSGPGLRVVSVWKLSGQGMSFGLFDCRWQIEQGMVLGRA